MTTPRTVAEVLSEHVVFEIECIDRMYLNVYVRQLQYAGGLVGYVHRQLGLPIASTAPLAKITDRFSAAVDRFAEDERLPWADFAKGQRKLTVTGSDPSPVRGLPFTVSVTAPGLPSRRLTAWRSVQCIDVPRSRMPWKIVAPPGVARSAQQASLTAVSTITTPGEPRAAVACGAGVIAAAGCRAAARARRPAYRAQIRCCQR